MPLHKVKACHFSEVTTWFSITFAIKGIHESYIGSV